MRSDRKILIAFLLNISFSIFEFIGGVFTNSVAIMSDAIHDFGDAISIGVSYFLERISNKGPDNKYTYGYVRYSVLGALFTNLILIVGSILVIIGAINRIINPTIVNYKGMIIFALFGVLTNFLAVYFTRDGNSLNQRAVNLHMLEDVVGWIVVLIGGIIIKFTNINIIDSILSVIVSLYILINAIKGIKRGLDLFLEKIPDNIDLEKLKNHLLEIDGVSDVHHIHVWSIDGVNNYATMHIISKIKDIDKLKLQVKDELKKLGISHSTIEMERPNYECSEVNCHIENVEDSEHHHIHHHH